jgi:hypothetical protein
MQEKRRTQVTKKLKPFIFTKQEVQVKGGKMFF